MLVTISPVNAPRLVTLELLAFTGGLTRNMHSFARLYRTATAFISFWIVEIQELMGTLLYLRQGIENSPYKTLYNPLQWSEIEDLFTREACAIHGMSVESPLSVV